MPVTDSTRDAAPTFRSRLRFLAAFALMSLTVFGADLGAVESKAVLPADRSIELWVHHLLGKPYYGSFEIVSTLGGTVDRLVEVVGLLVLLVIWRKWFPALFTVIAIGVSAALNAIVKDLVQRPRPHLFHWPVQAAGYSFPSGHADDAIVFSLVLVLVIWHLFRHDLATWLASGFAIVFAFLIGLSRIVLGVHYPSDVVGGYALGTVVVLATIIVLECIRPEAYDSSLNAPMSMTGSGP